RGQARGAGPLCAPGKAWTGRGGWPTGRDPPFPAPLRRARGGTWPREVESRTVASLSPPAGAPRPDEPALGFSRKDETKGKQSSKTPRGGKGRNEPNRKTAGE
ncbi:hypothetical protein H1C71_028803, partial [Ictidomys tridecemlineatus]